jgi:hypothetical protein
MTASSIILGPEDITVEEYLAVYAPQAEVPLEEAVAMISSAIEYCRDSAIRGLLIDASKLYGFPHPTVVERYWFVRKWASDAAGKVVLSFIQRPEMIDPDQIGVTIAANAGLTANVFDNESDARAWLGSRLDA